MPRPLRNLNQLGAAHRIAEDGFPRSMLRRLAGKCRCGNPLDRRWVLTLTDPLDGPGLTTSVPLCGSCGPVLFSQLADQGWLSRPTLAETRAAHNQKHEEKPCDSSADTK